MRRHDWNGETIDELQHSKNRRIDSFLKVAAQHKHVIDAYMISNIY